MPTLTHKYLCLLTKIVQTLHAKYQVKIPFSDSKLASLIHEQILTCADPDLMSLWSNMPVDFRTSSTISSQVDFEIEASSRAYVDFEVEPPASEKKTIYRGSKQYAIV